MEYKSVFDIIGPIMVGPSSSHTAGALGIARFARNEFKKIPEYTEIILYNSFAKTYRGHGTDVALIGGILGFEPDDLRIPRARAIAEEENIQISFVISDEDSWHPNTVRLILTDGFDILEIEGISIGGGSFKILKNVWSTGISWSESNVYHSETITRIMRERKQVNL